MIKNLNLFTRVQIALFLTGYITLLIMCFRLEKNSDDFAVKIIKLMNVQTNLTGAWFLLFGFLFLVVGVGI